MYYKLHFKFNKKILINIARAPGNLLIVKKDICSCTVTYVNGAEKNIPSTQLIVCFHLYRPFISAEYSGSLYNYRVANLWACSPHFCNRLLIACLQIKFYDNINNEEKKPLCFFWRLIQCNLLCNALFCNRHIKRFPNIVCHIMCSGLPGLLHIGEAYQQKQNK